MVKVADLICGDAKKRIWKITWSEDSECFTA